MMSSCVCGNGRWASLFQGEPIHCTRYLLNEAQAKTSLSAIRDIDDAQAELLSNVPSLFIQLPAECVYGNIPTEEQDLTESVFLPPGWHITGLTRVTDRKMFKVRWCCGPVDALRVCTHRLDAMVVNVRHVCESCTRSSFLARCPDAWARP